jgi:tetratricopeptide (TPR) repeat protein
MLHRGRALIVSTLLLAASMPAQSPTAEKTPAVRLLSGVGNIHHPVSTRNPEAQAYFDQGLSLVYGFNHEAAARSFRRAAELDPGLAMAWWGVAEAVGPNYNDPASPNRFQQGHEAVQKAVELSAQASPRERDYILAMVKRFPAGSNRDFHRAAEDYRDAMRELMHKYPGDLDAAVLFAESAMDLHAWSLWQKNGAAAEGTEEIVATLESVIQRDPDHIGALHYYIHAVEASPNPQRALSAAERLAADAPAAGHLVHMPAHVYVRTGDYDLAVQTNEKAAVVDRNYIANSGAPGSYSLTYYSHNLHFMAYAASMDGDYARAREAAEALANHVRLPAKEVPSLEGFLIVPLSVMMRFQRWNEILKQAPPDPGLPLLGAWWHFARGMALAAKGNTGTAQAERQKLHSAELATPPDALFAMSLNNHAGDILKIAGDVLNAKITVASRHYTEAVAALRAAVAVQDRLDYEEPPAWFYPVRESLGAVLLMSGDASAAEKVFRDDLEQNPRNPRSLFGLQQALKRQGREDEATSAETQFRAGWKGSPLQLDDLI